MEFIPELTKLLRTKSMIRYLPPKGTAGLARSRVSGKSRVPLPPASTTPKTRGCRVLCTAKEDSRSRIVFSGNQPSQNSSAARCYQRWRGPGSRDLRNIKRQGAGLRFAVSSGLGSDRTRSEERRVGKEGRSRG